jgi:putative ABC transport system substrate-binding protein
LRANGKPRKLLKQILIVNVLKQGRITYGANNYIIGQQSSEYLDKVLHGADPANMPLLQPTKIEFVLNQKLADQFGRKLPEALVASADEVIK